MITAEDLEFMKIAEEVGKTTTCGKLEVGCVIVKEGRIIGKGSNRTIGHYRPCSEVGHILNDEGRCMRQIHAEVNAVLSGNIAEMKGATVYVTHEPCENCTKILNHVGIKKIIIKYRLPNAFNQYFIEPMEWIYLENEGGK